MSTEAFVTLATNDSYALGALVWAASLRQVQTTRKIVILITKGLTDKIRNILPDYFDLIQEVDLFDSKDEKILNAMRRPELGVTLTKLHCWKLTQFTKCVFMDADTLVIKNIDELFQREELSAVADIGWPDCFNSGVFVFCPSQVTFDALVDLAAKEGSFDGGDQGLLNSYFADWATADISRHLSFVYNMSLASSYSYVPAFKRFGSTVKVIHFLGSMKPWFCSFNAETGRLNHYSGHECSATFVEQWWRTYLATVHPKLEATQLVGSMQEMRLQAPAPSTVDRFAAWQQGQVDYMGADSFDNILGKINQSINK